MKIKMLASFAGADFTLSPGDETDRFSKAEAVRMIEAGYAIPVPGVKRETTVRSVASTERRG